MLENPRLLSPALDRVTRGENGQGSSLHTTQHNTTQYNTTHTQHTHTLLTQHNSLLVRHSPPRPPHNVYGSRLHPCSCSATHSLAATLEGREGGCTELSRPSEAGEKHIKTNHVLHSGRARESSKGSWKSKKSRIISFPLFCHGEIHRYSRWYCTTTGKRPSGS